VGADGIIKVLPFHKLAFEFRLWCFEIHCGSELHAVGALRAFYFAIEMSCTRAVGTELEVVLTRGILKVPRHELNIKV
jgi:hypothetical protein